MNNQNTTDNTEGDTMSNTTPADPHTGHPVPVSTTLADDPHDPGDTGRNPTNMETITIRRNLAAATALLRHLATDPTLNVDAMRALAAAADHADAAIRLTSAATRPTRR